jgi:hypothetical protein
MLNTISTDVTATAAAAAVQSLASLLSDPAVAIEPLALRSTEQADASPPSAAVELAARATSSSAETRASARMTDQLLDSPK